MLLASSSRAMHARISAIVHVYNVTKASQTKHVRSAKKGTHIHIIMMLHAAIPQATSFGLL
jgi:hypothetical protein